MLGCIILKLIIEIMLWITVVFQGRGMSGSDFSRERAVVARALCSPCSCNPH